MKFSLGRLAAAGAVVGLLGVGGAGFAYAQTSSTSPSDSPTTTAPSGGAQSHSDANCPNMGQDNNQTSSLQM